MHVDQCFALLEERINMILYMCVCVSADIDFCLHMHGSVLHTLYRTARQMFSGITVVGMCYVTTDLYLCLHVSATVT